MKAAWSEVWPAPWSEPWFWREDTIAARAAQLALTPAALVYDAGQQVRARLARAVDPGIPVVCIGNATTGGVGKTPFALMVRQLLAAAGFEAAFLSRGYGGSLTGPVRVTDQHTAEEVGDEPLLLAVAAPTWIAKNRAAGAVAAARGGADLLIMDDGFQNPTVKKAVSILLIAAGDLDRRYALFPAGPLREPLARAIARADAVVEVGSAGHEMAQRPHFHAHTDIMPTIDPQAVVAFCGIGRPERFFDSLEAKGFSLASRVAFPDHHPFSMSDLAVLRRRAAKENAALITTEKDIVRLAPADRDAIAVARLALRVDDPQRLLRLIRERSGL